MSLIKIGLEEEFNNRAETNDFARENDLAELREEAIALDTGGRIERVMRSKIDRGEDLTDEEIYIAAETIGNLYSNLGSCSFSGFGFESFVGQDLTQRQKSKIALEAVSNQNADKANTWKAKFERFGHGMRDGFSTINGSLSSIKSNAQELLARVRSADDSVFTVKQVTDKRVSVALNQGYKKKLFANHKEVLGAITELTDSVKILSSASKYESLAGKEGSKYDLGQLCEDMDAKIVNKTNDRVTYDLNPRRLNGAMLTITIPDSSESNWVMRNLKANFVISSSDDGQGTANDIATSEISVKALSRKECEQLLEDVIKYTETEGRIYRTFYDNATTSVMEMLKMLGKGAVFFPIGNLVFTNSVIYRSRIDMVAQRIHLINRNVLRGLLAWVASSMK